LQHITNQLEYRLIKRRLEIGAAGWIEWTEEEAQAEAGGRGEELEQPPQPAPSSMEPPPPPPPRFVRVEGEDALDLEKAKATLFTVAITARLDDPLTISITPPWDEITTNDDELPLSAVGVAANRQSEFSSTLPALALAPGGKFSEGKSNELEGPGCSGLANQDRKQALPTQHNNAWVSPLLPSCSFHSTSYLAPQCFPSPTGRS
jgi:hypothetical protein